MLLDFFVEIFKCFIGIVVQCHTRYCYRYERSLFDSRRAFAQWGYRYRREPYFAGDYPAGQRFVAGDVYCRRVVDNIGYRTQRFGIALKRRLW